MRYIKIAFSAWRDGAAQATTELDAAAQKLAAIDERRRVVMAEAAHVQSLQKISDGAVLRDRAETAVAELDNIEMARRAALDAQSAAGLAAMAAAKSHKLVGSFGYQVVNDAAEVVGLVDERGQALPAGAVFEYSVIDAAPPVPAWAPKEPA
jgi:hypothetical protein